MQSLIPRNDRRAVYSSILLLHKHVCNTI
uniref:Uncharacterized protein n=1 Tax=Anguilla anguilla TaxID=7936 RepID=A0A0E9R3R1_ANGAN